MSCQSRSFLGSLTQDQGMIKGQKITQDRCPGPSQPLIAGSENRSCTEDPLCHELRLKFTTPWPDAEGEKHFNAFFLTHSLFHPFGWPRLTDPRTQCQTALRCSTAFGRTPRSGAFSDGGPGIPRASRAPSVGGELADQKGTMKGQLGAMEGSMYIGPGHLSPHSCTMQERSMGSFRPW